MTLLTSRAEFLFLLSLPFQQKPLGLLALLDEESNFPKGTDLTLLEKIEKNHGAHPNFEKPKMAKDAFCVKHYAGKVTYTITAFLDKNRDTLRAEWMTALMSSKNRFVSSLFAAEEVKEEDPTGMKTVSRGGGGRRGGSKIPTVGSQFNVWRKILPFASSSLRK